MANEEKVILEQAAVDLAKENEEPPYLYELPVAEGRKTVDEAQSGEVEKLEAHVERIEVIPTPTGTVTVTLYKPVTDVQTLQLLKSEKAHFFRGGMKASLFHMTA